MKMSVTAAILTTFVVLMGCSATSIQAVEKTSKANDMPDWVTNPGVQEGLAAAECVRATGNAAIDKKLATAQARSALIKQISVNVQAMDRTIERSVTLQTGSTEIVRVERSFESVSVQLANEALAGSRVTQSSAATINKVKHYCTQVALSPEATQNIFQKLLEASGAEIDAKYEAMLYDEFQSTRTNL